MAFTDTQTKALKAKLSHRHVRTRDSHGQQLAYVEGWHVIAEANRIFGFDSWDRQTTAPECIWSANQRGQTVCFYSTKVRVTVRAGGTITIREGIGTGLGRSSSPEVAHEIALKAAETDATKRALATFGNPFGLALYDRDQLHVTKPRHRQIQRVADKETPLVLLTADGHSQPFGAAAAFVGAIEREINALSSVDAVYEFWTRNMAGLADLRRRSEGGQEDPVEAIILQLKDRLRSLGIKPQGEASVPARVETDLPPLAIPKDKRLRDKGHLAFVASQPCLVCGRRPAQAHHLKFAQPRAMALKVSDEFTLPLCNVHHDQLHRSGDERAWWARNGIIEPLKYAERLWHASRHQKPIDAGDAVAAALTNDRDEVRTGEPGT